MPKLYLGPGLSRRVHQALCRRLEQFMAANTEVTAPGKALVCNTESRRTELCDDIEKVVVEGCLTNKQAQRLRGRMQFAESQLFGRTGKRCLRILSDFAEGRRFALTNKDKFFPAYLSQSA